MSIRFSKGSELQRNRNAADEQLLLKEEGRLFGRARSIVVQLFFVARSIRNEKSRRLHKKRLTQDFQSARCCWAVSARCCRSSHHLVVMVKCFAVSSRRVLFFECDLIPSAYAPAASVRDCFLKDDHKKSGKQGKPDLRW